jgi:beta-galactosidase
VIRLCDSTFVVGDRPTFFFGGELHYFRIEREAWRDRVQSAKRLGMNTVSSYIPWIWHEPEEGSFDFDGASHPQRDLASFLDIVESEGLWFVPRIGPVSNAELTGEGLPTWLFERYPDAQLRREDGSPMAGVPSYRHPLFLERVARWYAALMPILAPRTRGGRPAGEAPAVCSIPYVQLCNEIDMPTWLSRQPDHHTHVRDLWNEVSAEHAEARQPDRLPTRWPSARHTRWMDFYADYFAGYVRELSSRASELGVPFLVNIAQWTDHHDRGRGIHAPLTATMFRDVARSSPDVLVGGDYYPRRLDYDNFHDVVIATEVVRMISRPGAPIVCPELQSGGNEDRPRVYASDLELLLHVSAGHGLVALNAYMLAGGSNPVGLGAFGVEHDWQAPIGPGGELRPQAEALRRFGDFLAGAPGFAGTRKRFDTHFGFYAPYFQTEYLEGPEVAALEHRRVHVAQDGLLRLLTLDSVQFDFVDLTRSAHLGDSRSLVIFCEEWMDVATQTRLAEFLRAGGRLLLFPTVPTRGAEGEPCSVLADAIGSHPVAAPTRFVHAGDTTVPVPIANTFATAPADQVLGTTDDGAACVLSRRVGDGLVLLVGFGARHRFDRQVRLARSWLAELGVQPHLRIEPRDVVGVTRDDGRQLYVTLLNFHEEARSVRGSVDWNGSAVDLGTVELPARSARTVLATSSP